MAGKAFELQRRVEELKRALGAQTDLGVRADLRSSLLSAQRELALTAAAQSGVRNGPAPASSQFDESSVLGAYLRREFASAPEAWMLIDAGPGLTITDINPAWEAMTLVSREEVVGRSLFEVYPENPEDPAADGLSNVYASLRTVAATGRPHPLPIQRYDIRGADGEWVERYWQVVTIPIVDGDGRLAFLMLQAEPVEVA